MRTTEQVRVELLAALSRLGQLRPEWRLGQTLANLAMTAGRMEAGGVWDLEDEEALAAAKKLIEQYAEIEAVAVEPSASPGVGNLMASSGSTAGSLDHAASIPKSRK